MIALQTATPREWTKTALADFNAFLLDHAACERKASAVGMSFVVRYPDRKPLLEPMIHFAKEELEHFHQVFQLVAERGLILPPDEPDVYVNRLMKHVRTGREERFLDRLLVSGIIEARGFERLELISEAIEDEKLARFFQRLARAERNHRDLFEKLAKEFFPEKEVDDRLQELLKIEAEIILDLPWRSALH